MYTISNVVKPIREYCLREETLIGVVAHYLKEILRK